jgi:hypothetical protein
VTIAYQDDGSSIWSFQDHSQIIQNPVGAVVRQSTPDGWTFTAFDDKGRPTLGANAGLSATIAYDAAGNSVWCFTDGSVLQRDPNGVLVKETTSDGSAFTSFDTTGRLVKGTILTDPGAPAKSVSISYAADGSSVWNIEGGLTLYRDSAGTVIREVTPDGWVFTAFDDKGRPTAGVNEGKSATITYADDDGSVWTMGDGNVVTRNPVGAVLRVVTPEGAVFTSFDTAGRPTAGTMPGEDGGPPQPVIIKYLADGSSL